MSLISIIEENGIIFLGLFIAIVVMGIASLYDKYQKEGKISYESEIKQLSELKKKMQSFQLNKIEAPKLNKIQTDSLKKMQVQTLKKIKDFKLEKLQEKLKFQNLKNEMLKLSTRLKPENSSKTIDKLVESKKEELDFDDSLLTEMSTGDSFENEKDFGNKSYQMTVENSASENEFSEINLSPNNDLGFDENEFDIGLEEKEENSSEEEALFGDGLEELHFDDETDSLLDSLKKDIVVRKEEKIDFMAEMKGENLDLKSLKSEMEDILKELNKIKYMHQKC